MELVEAGGRLLAEPPADLDQLAAALFRLPAKTTKSAPGGTKGNWDDAQGGKDELQARYQAVVAGVTTLTDAYAQFLTASPSRSPTRSRAGRATRSWRSASSTSPTCWAVCATC